MFRKKKSLALQNILKRDISKITNKYISDKSIVRRQIKPF